MTKEQIIFLIGASPVPIDYVPILQFIFEEEEYKEPLWLMTKAFVYGVIIGKQNERAKRKKAF